MKKRNKKLNEQKVEERVEKILSKMTLEEKIKMIGGKPIFFIYPNKRLGIPEIVMTDGPLGAKCFGNSTAFAAGIALAASWNVALTQKVGSAIGKECRSRGAHFLLAPGVNIYRAPMCGRNFEYFGEDPFLASRTAVAYIKGVQKQGVVATAKHFAANNQEWDRHNVSSDVDERTLHEIYLETFRAAVKEAKVGAIMSAYNLLNGTHCSENTHLLTEILKKQWGFDGIVMSDWVSTYDGVAAANAGLDLEMPSGAFMNLKNLKPAIKKGKVKIETINDKIRRILRVIVRMGFLDRPQAGKSYPQYNTESDKIALEASRESIVLLKNERNLLPLNRKKIKSLAVIGPTAHPAVTGGGGSSQVFPFRSVSILEGLMQKAGKDIEVHYSPEIFNPYSELPINLPPFYTCSLENPKEEIQGLCGEYFNNENLSGKPVKVRIDRKIDFKWSGAPGKEDDDKAKFSARWTGKVKVSKTGKYPFMIRSISGFRVFMDGKCKIDEWENLNPMPRFLMLSLKRGKPVKIRLEYRQNRGTGELLFTMHDLSLLDRIQDTAAKCDAAIVCVGYNHLIECEGFDRPFELPPGQAELIRAVAKVNPKTVVVLVGGGNAEMSSWLPKVRGLVHAWFPGQEGGKAVAEVLFGDVNPSGKLPATFEKKWSDNACSRSYYDKKGKKRVKYSEGIFLGYRFFDTYKKEPLFPFGFGLSYTKFKYSNLALSAKVLKAGKRLKITAEIKNTGKRRGKEAVQLYIRDVKCSVPRPVKELKGFAKLDLKPGQKKTVSFKITKRHLSFYDVKTSSWVAEPGKFEVLIGASSRDIRLKRTFEYPDKKRI